MRAILEMIVPQVHEGDHETTAEILHTGSQETLALEMFRLLVYLEANDMIPEFNAITGCNADLSNPKNMMDFLRRMGFLTKANIERLGRSAVLTIQVFLERLLYYSTTDENSCDVMEWLVPSQFSVNHLVRADPHFRERPNVSNGDGPMPRPIESGYGNSLFLSLLEASSLEGNASAVRLLLDLGADPYDHPGKRNFSPLHWAATLLDQDRAILITGLLLSKPTTSSSELQKQSLDSALGAALARHSTKLVEMLLSERQRIGHGGICSEHFTTAARVPGSDMIRILVDHAALTGDGSVMLPHDILFSAIFDPDDANDPDALVDKLNFLLGHGADPAVLKCSNGCKRGFILDWMMRFAVDEMMEEDCVLKMIETMRKHGCNPKRPKPASGGDYDPSVLQAAIYLGYPRLVEFFLDWGVDANFCRGSSEQEPPECVDCRLYDDEDLCMISGRSPLSTALAHQRTEIAKILLRRFPKLELRGGEQRLAMGMGNDTELVTMILQAGSTEIDAWKGLLEQALMMRNPESIKLLMSMNPHGYAAIDNVAILRAALVTGDQDTAYQQIAICSYNSQALLEAVFRSRTSKDYLRIVELLLESRQPAPNDDFEICAVASAARQYNTYLVGVLMKNFGQGPWITSFPLQVSGHDAQVSPWAPDSVLRGHGTHILKYAARFDKGAVLKTLLEFDVPAEGMHLDVDDDLSAETWTQLIAVGVDPNLRNPLHYAVGGKMLAHVEALCKGPVLLDTMHHEDDDGGSRTAIQVAVESGCPKMLEVLLHHGADVNDPAGYFRGGTCLQLAAGAGQIGIVRLMLDKGAEVNAKRSLFHGRTAIEIAAENGRLDVLKLLLLRDQHLFQTAAQRYQFIRAAKLAERTGNKFIIDMLRQHIRWNNNDQQLFDEIKSSQQLNIHLDEMTQELLDGDKLDEAFWLKMDRASEAAGLYDIYEIDGIEEWIGRPDDEQSEDWTTCETKYSSEGEDDTLPEDISSTGHYTKANQEGKVPAGESRCQSELQPGMAQAGAVAPTYDEIHGRFADCADLRGDLVYEQQARHWDIWRLQSEMDESIQTSAPQALRYQDSNPVWLEMEDNDIDDVMQDLSGGPCPQVTALEILAPRSATQSVTRESVMVLGEVLDEGPHINDMGDDAVDNEKVVGIGEAGQSIEQDFNWGFWDEESFRFQSEQPGNW